MHCPVCGFWMRGTLSCVPLTLRGKSRRDGGSSRFSCVSRFKSSGTTFRVFRVFSCISCLKIKKSKRPWAFAFSRKTEREMSGSTYDRRDSCQPRRTGSLNPLKEVIQPQVPLRLPCYDFTPVAVRSVGGCLHCWLAHRLRVQTTPMV